MFPLYVKLSRWILRDLFKTCCQDQIVKVCYSLGVGIFFLHTPPACALPHCEKTQNLVFIAKLSVLLTKRTSWIIRLGEQDVLRAILTCFTSVTACAGLSQQVKTFFSFLLSAYRGLGVLVKWCGQLKFLFNSHSLQKKALWNIFCLWALIMVELFATNWELLLLSLVKKVIDLTLSWSTGIS